MIVDLPPSPPGITAEQAADLRCVSMGQFLQQQAKHRRIGKRMVATYANRLQLSDAARDWKTLALQSMPTDSMLYGDFMGILNTCAVPPTRKPPARSK